jgi:hypothetical protein
MIRLIITLFVFSFFTGILIAEDANWSVGTTEILPIGRMEVGVFQPLRYGLNETVELSSHVLANILMPNIAVKKAWRDCHGFNFTTRHSLTYPTPLLNVIARKGTGGILPDNTVVPHIITISNQLMIKRQLTDKISITPEIGFTFALKFGDSDMTTIDLPLIYTRTSVYHNGWLANVGIDLTGQISDNIEFLVDLDRFIMPRDYASFAYEHKGLLIYHKSSKFSVLSGYKLVYSDYPSKLQRRWDIFPLVDMMWKIK